MLIFSILVYYGFSNSHVQIWELGHKEGWTPKNWCFQIATWKKVLKSPLGCKETKLVNPVRDQLEGLMLKLKRQFFGHLRQKANSLEKTLMLGKIDGRRSRWWQRVRRLDGITDSVSMNLSKFWEMVEDRGAWHAAVHGVTKNWTWLSDWTTLLAVLIISTSFFIAVKSTVEIKTIVTVNNPQETRTVLNSSAPNRVVFKTHSKTLKEF